MSKLRIHSLSEFVNVICELDGTLIRNGADKNEGLLGDSLIYNLSYCHRWGEIGSLPVIVPFWMKKEI